MGFALTDPSGQNIWAAKDLLQGDPAVSALMSQLFGRRASNDGLKKSPESEYLCMTPVDLHSAVA